jgi:chemotaxis protein CheD
VSSIAELLATSGLSRLAPETSATDGARVIYLHAGQLVTSAEPAQITTILGSCVAICVWDPVARVGGMNHFMLPYDGGPNVAGPRYAKFATATLLVDVALAGATASRLQAKLFGGACVMEAFRAASRDLGTQNVEVARQMLAAAHVAIVAEDVGGKHGRKLVFRTDNGEALVKIVR